jgi:hypothetical protein
MRHQIILALFYILIRPSQCLNIIVGVYGEIERWDPFASTLPGQVVTPLARFCAQSSGRIDVAIVAQRQLRERQTQERFRDRWKNLQPYSFAGGNVVAAGMKSAFKQAGAHSVFMETYELGNEGLSFGGHIARQDPTTGNCATPGCLKPHDTPSVRAHLYARFRLLQAIKSSEGLYLHGVSRYDWVVIARNDGRWFGPILKPELWPTNTVLVKACAAWTGLNDKFGIVPRVHVDSWLDTASDLGNETLRFSSVETLLLAIAQRDNMQVCDSSLQLRPEHYQTLPINRSNNTLLTHSLLLITTGGQTVSQQGFDSESMPFRSRT